MCDICCKPMELCNYCQQFVDYDVELCHRCQDRQLYTFWRCDECEDNLLSFAYACRNGETDVIDSLIDKVDVNKSPDDYTFLQVACEYPSLEQPWAQDVVRRLLQAGADVDADCSGKNPLQRVLGWNSFDHSIASMLLYSSKLGINCQINGQSYLYSCRTVEAIKFLIDNGIDINSRDSNGRTYPEWLETTYRQRGLQHIRRYIQSTF